MSAALVEHISFVKSGVKSRRFMRGGVFHLMSAALEGKSWHGAESLAQRAWRGGHRAERKGLSEKAGKLGSLEAQKKQKAYYIGRG